MNDDAYRYFAIVSQKYAILMRRFKTTSRFFPSELPKKLLSTKSTLCKHRLLTLPSLKLKSIG